MFERIRIPLTAALILVFVSLPLVLVRAPTAAARPSPAAGGSLKRGDYGTATPGAATAASAQKPPAAQAGAGASGEITKPGVAGVASVSATAQITNVAVCAATADQTGAVMVPDGAEGGVVVWQDKRVGEWDIYAQRVGVGGATQWGLNGVPVCKAGGGQTSPRAVADGTGGFIVVWQDGRPGAQGQDLYAQRLSASGVEQWASGGVLLCGEVGDQKRPVAVADGQGGAIVAWVDERALGSDVYAQRISASGAVQWTVNGVALCTAVGVQQDLAMVTDGQRGAIVTWQDQRGGTGDIYARRVDESGVAQWTANGVGLCTATGVQETPAAMVDGMGGAIVGWADARGAGQDVYVQRVSGAGAVQWTGNGVGVCTAAADQGGPAIAADPLGGAVVAWSDARTAGNGADIYVQHVSVAGAAQWTANGVLVCDAPNGQDSTMVVADGQGGALAAWRDLRGGTTPDIYGQRVDASGQVAAQCSVFTLLSGDIPVTATSAQSYYKFDQTDFYWCGVGVRNANGSDWDMESYQPVTFGTSPYPVCFSGSLAGSFASSGVDFVVGDFNSGHTLPVFPASDAGYGVRAFRYSGSGNGTVEWDDGPDAITKDCGTGGNCGAKSVNNWTGVLDVWDVYLFANQAYTFDFTRTGSADIKLLLFSSAGTSGTFFAPRSARQFETTSQYTVYTAPTNAWYGVVLVNDNGLAGTYTVRVVTGVPATGVGEAPASAAGLRGVAPNPSAGRVQIQFALREPGEVAFDVLDMAGRMVARIPGRRWEAGAWSASWDGRTARGTPAAAGIYFVQMRVDERRVGLGRVAFIR